METKTTDTPSENGYTAAGTPPDEPGTSVPPPTDRDPLEDIKRRVYLASLITGIPPIPLLWATARPEELFMRFGLPVLMGLCLWCMWALWSRRVPLWKLERIVFASVSAFVLGQLAFRLSAASGWEMDQASLTETTYPMLAILCIIAHLIFDTRTALRFSLGLFGAASVLVGAGTLVRQNTANIPLDQTAWIAQQSAFLAAVIALVYATSYVKAQLARQRTLAEAMHRLAHTDPLTGISNRRSAYAALRREMEAARRYDKPLSVILFDLDHFKRLNDTYGHNQGDIALRRVANTVRGLLRTSDHFGRWGGEEFIVLAPETDLEQASSLAERLRQAISRDRPQGLPQLTASFGTASYRAGDSPEELLRRADEGLYRAKEQGRNRTETAA
ncbi:MAG: GGDEF domain-containing protein [Rubrobacter sp.]|nr:GGDEF domain-containing protein [Rubrobacter sp.]